MKKINSYFFLFPALGMRVRLLWWKKLGLCLSPSPWATIMSVSLLPYNHYSSNSFIDWLAPCSWNTCLRSDLFGSIESPIEIDFLNQRMLKLVANFSRSMMNKALRFYPRSVFSRTKRSNSSDLSFGAHKCPNNRYKCMNLFVNLLRYMMIQQMRFGPHCRIWPL